MNSKTTFLLSQLALEFEKQSNETKAIQMKAYMRNQFEFYGIPSPQRNDITNKIIVSTSFDTFKEMETFLYECLKHDEREWFYVALDTLIRFKKLWTKESIHFIEFFLLKNTWWDTLDLLSANVVGPYFKTFPEIKTLWIEKWMASDNFWLNRVCIIFQLKYKTETDYLLLTDAILLFKESNEFFVQKAIGWALREISKQNPQFVIHFTNNYDIKPLSKREALKIINKKQA